MTSTHLQLSTMYKAFCDENRLSIIDRLTQGEHCACDLLEQLEIGQSTLSHHMRILVDSGVVSARKSGKWTYYALSEAGCDKAIADLVHFVSKKESKITPCACEERDHETSGY